MEKSSIDIAFEFASSTVYFAELVTDPLVTTIMLVILSFIAISNISFRSSTANFGFQVKKTIIDYLPRISVSCFPIKIIYASGP